MGDNHKDIIGNKNPMFGKHHSEETRSKISEKHKGKHPSEKTKQKISSALMGNDYGFQKDQPSWNKGISCCEETKQKISIAHAGKVLSEEHKQKISLTMRNKTTDVYLRLQKYGFQKGNVPSIKCSYGKQSICDKGHWVRSSWERKFVDLLFNENIPYLYEPERFNLKGIFYLPDIYIPGMMLWIEIKGNMTIKNKIQHELFRRLGHKLLILDNPNEFEQELNKLVKN